MSSGVSSPTPASDPGSPSRGLPFPVMALLLIRGSLAGLACAMIWNAAMTDADSPPWGEIALQVSVFAVLALGVAWFRLLCLPLFADPVDSGLCVGGLTEGQMFPYDEMRALQPIPPAAVIQMLMVPGGAQSFLTRPIGFDDWWSLRTDEGEFLFRCRAGEAPRPRMIRSVTSGAGNAALIVKYQPFRLEASWPLDLGFCVAALLLPALMPLLVLYAIWRIYSVCRRDRARSVWARLRLSAGQIANGEATEARAGVKRQEPVRPFRASLIAWLWSSTALPLLLLRLSIPVLPALRALISGVVEMLWKGLVAFLRVLLVVARGGVQYCRPIMLLLVGWLSTLLLATLLPPLFVDPLIEPPQKPWQVRVALLRHGEHDAARLATSLLENALKDKDEARVHAVLEGGARNGEFRLAGWQEALRREGRCRDAVPKDSGVRMVLAESMDAAGLLRELACTGAHLQHDLLIEAFRNSGGTMDIMSAVASGHVQLLELSDQTSGVDAVRDWQGRTPLLLTLDLMAGDRSEASADRRRPGWQTIAARLQEQGADPAATDRSGRSGTYLALAAGLSGELFAPYRRAGAGRGVTTLGATLLHAAATSGSPAAVDEALGLGVDLRARTIDGRSALHFARGSAMVRTLFLLGLDPDLRDVQGRTPLHAAVIAGDAEAASALAAIMLQPLATDSFGRTPLDYLPVSGEESTRWKALRDIINERATRT